MLHCRGRQSCQSSTVICPSEGQCNVYCDGDNACQFSDFTCSEGGTCLFHFEGNELSVEQVGAYATILCKENSVCKIICAGKSRNIDNQCFRLSITCPQEGGKCTVECTGGSHTCQYANIICGRGNDCLNCSGKFSCLRATITFLNGSKSILNCTGPSSCQYANIICPVNSNCTVNCNDSNSCNYARVTCPTGDYSCNVLCTAFRSCSNLTITNTHNVNLQCCGGQSCTRMGISPTSTDC